MAQGKSDAPPTWQDALSQASQVIAAGLAAPDADVKFGLALIGALATHTKRQGSGPGGAAGPGGAPGGGVAGFPSAGGPDNAGGPPGTPPGVSGPAGPAGGGAPNAQMPTTAPPGAPTGPQPGGMTPGLSPNPDELRRVLSDVAGQ